MNRLMNGLIDVKYAFYLIFHPFNGFWDLKHEKKGSMAGSSFILAMTILVLILRNQFTGFILNYNYTQYFNVFFQITNIVLPLLIWCIANWCITTLVDGEGSIRDIFITTTYSLFPIVLFNIPMVILSNLILEQEATFYKILDNISIGWAILLLFIGIMTVHQFSIKKTIFTIFIALLGMVIIIFIFLMFIILIQNMLNLIKLLYNEVALRTYS